MQLGRISVDTHGDVNHLVRSNKAAYVSGEVNSYLTVGDCVRIQSFRDFEAEYPSFIGRITAVSFTSDQISNNDAIHPHLRNRNHLSSEALFRIQIYVPNDDSLLPTQDLWRHVPAVIQRACQNVPGNILSWVNY